MRLGQLARKLDLRPAEIVEFLATKNIQVDDDANAKIADDDVTLVFRHFAPDRAVENISDADIPPVTMANIQIPEELVVPNETVDSPITPVDVEAPEPIELIKAAKVELSGLKVLGKIDLPEPKKKQTETPSDGAPLERPKEANQERRSQHKKTQRPTKNPIALQREREASEAKKKKEEEHQLQKERRTQNYLKKVKAHQPTKAARLIKEQAEEITSLDLTEPPKTWLGKFIKWLTT